MGVKVAKIGDLLAYGLIFLSIFIFNQALNSSGLMKIIGIGGAVIVIIVEATFIWKSWRKDGK